LWESFKTQLDLALFMYVDYKKLDIWKLAYSFVLDIYHEVENFPEYESNNITSQLRRAATCLPLNIAEGSGARSPRIFLNFLIFAYRSGREIETLLMLSKDLKYLSKEKYDKLYGQLDVFTRRLAAYMNYLENDVIKTKRKKDLSPFFRQKKEALVNARKREGMGGLRDFF
jgi:four helix bundle protein